MKLLHHSHHLCVLLQNQVMPFTDAAAPPATTYTSKLRNAFHRATVLFYAGVDYYCLKPLKLRRDLNV